MLLLTKNYYYKKVCLTLTKHIKSEKGFIAKRFYGKKPTPGHAKVILDAAMKNKSTNIPTQSSTTSLQTTTNNATALVPYDPLFAKKQVASQIAEAKAANNHVTQLSDKTQSVTTTIPTTTNTATNNTENSAIKTWGLDVPPQKKPSPNITEAVTPIKQKENNASTTTVVNSPNPVQNNSLQKNDPNTKPKKPIGSAITETTTIDTISKELIFKEAEARNLIKDNHNKAGTELLTESGKSLVVGSADKKLATPLGPGLFVQASKNELEYLENPTVTLLPGDMVIVSITNESMLPSTEVGHLNIVALIVNNKWASIGYLTSKTTGELLSNTQLINYQKQRQAEETNAPLETPNSTKAQYYAPYPYPCVIPNDKFEIIKWGSDYLKTKTNPTILSNTILTLDKTKAIILNPNNFTPETCLKACQLFDYIVIKKKPFPKTLEQFEIEKKNHEAQKEKNKIKNATKNKPTIENENNNNNT